MSEWSELSIGELPLVIGDGNYSSKYPSAQEFKESGVPFISNKDIKNGRIIRDAVRYISPEKHAELKKGHIREHDILVSTRANIGDIAYVDSSFEDANINAQLVFLRCDEITLHSKFLYHLLSSKHYHTVFQNHASGSAQMQLPIAALREIPIIFPGIEEQKAIASILSSFDDKIDLLHRQNKTLEAMAEALFRQWFVESVGEDWPEVKITDLFEVRDGTHDSPKPTPIGRTLITSKHILDGRLDIQGAYLISDDDFDKVNSRSQVHSSDILFSMIGTIGSIYFERSSEINYAIKNIGLFKTSQNKEWAIYTYLWLKSPSGRQYIDEHKSGSTQEYVSLGSLRNIVFQSPSQDFLKEFNQICQVYLDKVYNNQLQIQLLEKLRDGLLPKLMSGEVRVL